MLRNNIKYYRKKFKITQEELGQKMNIKYGKQYISKIENNQVNVTIPLAFKVVKAFKDITLEKGQQVILTVDDLFYIDEE